MLTREQLQRAASDTGFPIDSLEKVSMLVRLLNLMAAHPFLGPRIALKGGTALAQVAGRLGLTVKRAPGEHAGGKWRLSYNSALGRPAIIEVDD